MDPTRVVVDTNILFAALLHKEAQRRETILTDQVHRFFCPRFVMVELFKHKERIAAATNLPEDELLDCLSEILARITFVEEGVIPIGTWMEGRRLCREWMKRTRPLSRLLFTSMDGSGAMTLNSKPACWPEASTASSFRNRAPRTSAFPPASTEY